MDQLASQFTAIANGIHGLEESVACIDSDALALEPQHNARDSSHIPKSVLYAPGCPKARFGRFSKSPKRELVAVIPSGL